MRFTVLPALVAAAVVLTSCSTAESDTATAGAGTRAVEHARGTTQVPDAPQRVVVLEPLELDTAVAVGITPVGAAVASNVAGVPKYLGADGITPVGTVPEPDLEAIAALKPDLILGTESRHAKLYDQLASVAPTVYIATQADPWQDNAMLIGTALNKADQVKTLLDGYNERCAAIKAEHELDGKTANLIRPRDETTLSLYGPVSFAGSTLQCTGFTIPEQTWEDGLQADLSPENIGKAKANHVFVTTADVTDTSTIPAAIRDNQAEFPSVTLVDTAVWVSGVGPKGAQIVLDDIEKFLDAAK
ncbi:ABC transporter substrate-binding protein [Actinoplanes sp. G11-F43]|uniref:ABC transporter substrate-binding protein n=1 Tax=Actinoplanes sp. G11-F43 TaxID=3424130 RepID=UPI003D335775